MIKSKNKNKKDVPNKTKEKEVPKKTKEIALSIKKLYKKYKGNDVYSIQDLTFDVRPGEFHGFIGANGAGKTTTIKSIIGAYAKFRGEIKIFGHKNSSIEGKKRIGYIPEAANFPKELNSMQYISKMAILSGVPRKEAEAFAIKKLTELGMIKFKHANPNNLSSGQKKKVLLAQALIGEPDLIIMDEPAANLDPKARSDFFSNLKQLQKKGKAIFISSHILAEISEYVDTVTIIDHGKLLFSGKVTDVNKGNKNSYLFSFKNIKDRKEFETHLKKTKMTSKKEAGVLRVTLTKKENIYKLLQFISKKKLEIDFIKENIKSLQNIYDDYVNKGKGVKHG